MRANSTHLTVLIALALLAGAAHAEPAVQDVNATVDTGAHRHDGFFLRMATGPAAIGAAYTDEDGEEYGVGGGGSQFELSIGGALTDNLVLHGDLITTSASSLDGEQGGQDVDLPGQRLSVGAVGLGLTYFVMPLNLSITGSVLAAHLRLEDEDDWNDTDDRLTTRNAGMARLTVTKEWWVSDNWALGLAGSVYGGAGQSQAAHDRADDKEGDEVDVGFGGASLMFSATFN